ncbi:MAG: cyclase family protein [Pyrinomonadaceae bacterium]|nr:cyclase family protein [Pyrinomonadaceae bacterium]
MAISIQIEDKSYRVEPDSALDISIPLRFNGDQPNAYDVEKATSKPVEAGELVGDTRLGGSVNFEQYKFIPHCNGTHTECIGHITNDRISIRECLMDAFIPATLISLIPVGFAESEDNYSPEFGDQDKLITRDSIEHLVPEIQYDEALIIRTLPNNVSKLNQQYGEYIPPFFSNEAMELIIDLGVKHMLVDLPSIDRIFDGGALTNHRRFWNVEDGKFEINENSRTGSTITELIYVPDEIKDGKYLLNLQIAAFESDASPSRPLLFKLK